ncbi:unnamed protein product [Ixodes pacificus]
MTLRRVIRRGASPPARAFADGATTAKRAPPERTPREEMVAPSRGALVRGRPCSRTVLLVRDALHACPALLATSERAPRPLPPRFSEKGAGAAAAACPGRGEESTPQPSGERHHHITRSR